MVSATNNALADSGKVAAIADFVSRVDRGYDWSRSNKDAYIAFYAGFAKQDAATIEKIYPDEAAYKRQPIDDTFVASLQTVFETWKEAGVLTGSLNLGDYVYRDIPIN